MRGEKRQVKDEKPTNQKKTQPTAELVIIWTSCPKCGETWGTRAVTVRGRCRICGGKAKAQEEIPIN